MGRRANNLCRQDLDRNHADYLFQEAGAWTNVRMDFDPLGVDQGFYREVSACADRTRRLRDGFVVIFCGWLLDGGIGDLYRRNACEDSETLPKKSAENSIV